MQDKMINSNVDKAERLSISMICQNLYSIKVSIHCLSCQAMKQQVGSFKTWAILHMEKLQSF